MLALLILILLIPAGCAHQNESHVDIPDNTKNKPSILLNSEELIAFVDSGTSDTIELSSNIDLGDKMITLTKERGLLHIIGGGYKLMSSADCVIRLEDGAQLSLSGITIIGSVDGIGLLGNASILFDGASSSIVGALHGIHSGGKLQIDDGGTFTARGTTGCGILAPSIEIGVGVSVSAFGADSAVKTTQADLVLGENAKLSAKGGEGDPYNIVKVTGTLVLEAGSDFSVENTGLYHGAEIGALVADPSATVQAKGGQNGVGLFLFTLKEDLQVRGFCEPAPRHENGKGSLTFTD